RPGRRARRGELRLDHALPAPHGGPGSPGGLPRRDGRLLLQGRPAGRLPARLPQCRLALADGFRGHGDPGVAGRHDRRDRRLHAGPHLHLRRTGRGRAVV
ncbi:MAG: hypothetical protein AVDCRST_MAG52-3124, partial [uncultured Blastococcus sp.]